MIGALLIVSGSFVFSSAIAAPDRHRLAATRIMQFAILDRIASSRACDRRGTFRFVFPTSGAGKHLAAELRTRLTNTITMPPSDAPTEWGVHKKISKLHATVEAIRRHYIDKAGSGGAHFQIYGPVGWFC